VIRAVFGIDKYERGSVHVEGRRLPPGSTSAAIAAGLALDSQEGARCRI
jgi:rhamnose transport system ATP-binding protein